MSKQKNLLEGMLSGWRHHHKILGVEAKEMAEGQDPKLVTLSCSDSRVDVDEILERSLSELSVSCELSEAELARHLLDRVRAMSERPEEIEGEHWGCDTRRAARELGFEACRFLDEAAGEVIESYLRNGLLNAPDNVGVGTEV